MNTRHSATAAAVAPSAGVERRKPGWLERFTDHFQRYWQLWVLSAPALVFVAIFAYVPMWGIQLAFRKFDSAKGLTGGEWVGLHYFEQSFTSPLFGEILWNTFRISLWTLVTGFIGKLFGDESLLGSTTAITAVYWISEVWQHRGWNCIIYLAALSSVDPSLYEAAKIDGAGRFQLIRYVDFPAILPTAGVLLILQMGSVLNVGYTRSTCSSSARNRTTPPPSACMRMANASPNASWTPTCTDSASRSTSTRRNGTRWRSSTPPYPTSI